MDKLRPFKEGENLDLYLNACVTQFKTVHFPKTEWKSFLSTKLTPEVVDHVADVFEDENASYEELKSRLLDHAGLTDTKAATDFHSLDSQWLITLSPSQIVQRAKRLAEHITKQTTIVDQANLLHVVAKLKTVVDSELKIDLELHNPATWDSLITVLNTYYKSHDSSMQPISGNTNPTASFKSSCHKPHGKPSLFCHHCKNTGHRTSSCWHAQSPSSNEVSIYFSGKVIRPNLRILNPLTNSSAHAQPHSPHPVAKPNPVEVVCYSCGEKGHKSPACPSRRGEDLEYEMIAFTNCISLLS